MSNKPAKKSDSGKAWMRQRRDRAIRIAPEYHLIVSEGIKTEPQYFKGLKNDLGRYRDKITLEIEGTGKNTLTLFEEAEELANRYERYGKHFSHVWIVFDKDDFPPDNFDNTADICEKRSNSDRKYHALWSNECIEYWFLLHFEYLNTGISREQYYPKLSKHLNCEYVKNDDKIYDKLKPMYKTAIRNAKKMLKAHEITVPSKCCPGTTVYEIFDYLKPYIDENK